MKPILVTLIAFYIFYPIYGQEKSDKYFLQAIDEITLMLNDIKPIDFKRAVFLTENAYFEGFLNWEEFCTDIENIKIKLNKLIDDKGLRNHKSAGNWAAFTYMTEKIPENDSIPMQYDFENYFGDKNYNCFMVWTLIKTKKGNCHSLPYFYKIMADELNSESFLAIAPLHVFIKQKDEQGQWWNLELTSGSFSRTSFIIEYFNVTDAGIESGLYLKPLGGKDLLILCLTDLLNYYEKRTRRYYGEVVRKAYEIGLKYSKVNHLQIWKRDDLKHTLDKKMKARGLTKNEQISLYPDLELLRDEIQKTDEKIKSMGYYKPTPEQYKEKKQEIDKMKSTQNKQ